MGLNATWSMAVGGMIGGGIFSVLGLTVRLAGDLAWLSFLLAGLIAFATAVSYTALTVHFKEGGGAFTYIKDISHEELAGGLSWLLIIGYTLTISVYASTFGHYLAYVMGIEGLLLPRIFALGVILVFIGFNLRGVGEASLVEIVSVWGKLIILFGISTVGILRLDLHVFTTQVATQMDTNVLVASASIFMAYEGFQLITYDYETIREPQKTIFRAEILALVTVIVTYVIVSIGVLQLVGAEAIIEKEEVAIAVAGQKAFGSIGLIIATLGALFSTGSAINSTLFSTANLAKKVAADRELPRMLRHENVHEIPDRAILLIGGFSAFITLFGSLGLLVEGASFIFLLTFAIVNWIALAKVKEHRVTAGIGLAGSLIAASSILLKIILNQHLVLMMLALLMVFVTLGRKYILKWTS
jgi:amino acid transporter